MKLTHFDLPDKSTKVTFLKFYSTYDRNDNSYCSLEMHTSDGSICTTKFNNFNQGFECYKLTLKELGWDE